MKRMIVVLLFTLWFATGMTNGAEPSVASLPPSIIKTIPQCGATNVDASSTKQIQVTFSKEMRDASWSWVQIGKETFPEMAGKPRYLKDHKTCVVDVKLEPHKTYVIWLNSEKYGNFKDIEGYSAVPYLLVFETK